MVYAAGAAQGIVLVTFPAASLGCSALLPLTISFGQEQPAAMAGGVIAFYQLGYGIAAFGTGPLLDDGVGLSSVYAAGAAFAAAMGLLSFASRAGGCAKPTRRASAKSVAAPVERRGVSDTTRRDRI